MANENGHPDIVKIGQATQFGQPGGPNPAETAKKGKPWSIRKALEALQRMPIDNPDDMAKEMKTAEVLKKLCKYMGVSKPTRGMLNAIRLEQQAAMSGKIMLGLIEQVEGKLVEKRVETQVTLEQLVAGNYDAHNSEE